MPKVSVIIPIYGVEKYIERCARSLFEQTLDDIEYIFINDCSKDRSIELLKKVIQDYPHRYNQIIIENMLTNSGLPAVRQHGIKLATGDYIIHCDSDDWVEKTMYSQLYNKAIKDNLDIVICDYYKTDGYTHKKIQSINETNINNIYADLISQKIAVAVWNKLIKREIYFDKIIYPKHNMGEDYALIVQLAMYAKSFGYIPSPLYYYFNNPNSISNITDNDAIANKWIGLNKNILLVSNFLKENGKYDKYCSEIEFLIFKYKDKIIPFIADDNKYKKIWLNLYPNLNFWNEKGLKNKIRYIIIYFGLYPFINKLKKRFN